MTYKFITKTSGLFMLLVKVNKLLYNSAHTVYLAIKQDWLLQNKPQLLVKRLADIMLAILNKVHYSTLLQMQLLFIFYLVFFPTAEKKKQDYGDVRKQENNSSNVKIATNGYVGCQIVHIL
ncbi:hypothetical protein DICVIV_04737 [Dictyocaulus viviparus]|uniref:Uncharacterized protein n=1 Tax=Dictyocaulus viviparus TaxID=29172 RepID=A0A0D8XZ19_DICVI|nr:hypothetical protein DICVIV_04737 [Dictyocaulus viviparus]